MSTWSLPLIVLIFTSRLLLKQVKDENAITTRKQSEETYYKLRILDTLHSAVNSSSFGIRIPFQLSNNYGKLYCISTDYRRQNGIVHQPHYLHFMRFF